MIIICFDVYHFFATILLPLAVVGLRDWPMRNVPGLQKLNCDRVEPETSVVSEAAPQQLDEKESTRVGERMQSDLGPVPIERILPGQKL